MAGDLSDKWKIRWMLRSFWKATCPTWCASYNCSNSSKNNPAKTLFTFPENKVHQKRIDKTEKMAALNRKDGWVKPGALLCKVSTLTSNQLSAEHCSNVTVLKHKRCKAWWEQHWHWFNVYHTVFLAEADLGHLQSLG